MSVMPPNSTPVEIVSVNEPWATAKMPDGTLMRVKVVFTGAARINDANGVPMFAEDGNPMYALTFTQTIDAQAPDAARRPTNGESLPKKSH